MHMGRERLGWWEQWGCRASGLPFWRESRQCPMSETCRGRLDLVRLIPGLSHLDVEVECEWEIGISLLIPALRRQRQAEIELCEVGGQLGLHSKFQDDQGLVERQGLKSKDNSGEVWEVLLLVQSLGRWNGVISLAHMGRWNGVIVDAELSHLLHPVGPSLCLRGQGSFPLSCFLQLTQKLSWGPLTPQWLMQPGIVRRKQECGEFGTILGYKVSSLSGSKKVGHVELHWALSLSLSLSLTHTHTHTHTHGYITQTHTHWTTSYIHWVISHTHWADTVRVSLCLSLSLCVSVSLSQC